MNETQTQVQVGTVEQVKPLLDIMSKTSNYDLLGVPECEMDAISLQVIQVADLETIGQLKRRILEFLHFNSLKLRPIKLGTVNRRFAKVASRLGTNTLEIVQQLVQTSQVKRIEHGKVTAYVSMQFYAPYKQGFVDEQSDIPSMVADLLTNAQ